MPKPTGARPQRSNTGRQTAFDQALIKAKDDKSKVQIFLPVDTEFTDSENCVYGKVLHVDVYSILLLADLSTATSQIEESIWLNKSYIVAVIV